MKSTINSKFVCSVSYTDGTHSSFAATIIKSGNYDEMCKYGDINTVFRLIGVGKLQEAIQNINSNLVICTSGIVDKKIRECNITFAGMVTIETRRRRTKTIPFGVIVHSDKVCKLEAEISTDDCTAVDMIQEWIDQIVENN